MMPTVYENLICLLRSCLDLCERRKLLTIFNVNFGQKYYLRLSCFIFEEQDLYNWLAPLHDAIS